MNYDPNSDQELERSPQPAEDIPAAQEDVQLTPPASLPDEQAQPVPLRTACRKSRRNPSTARLQTVMSRKRPTNRL